MISFEDALKRTYPAHNFYLCYSIGLLFFFLYALEPSVTRYAKIALELQNKTVRDVALRCKWMTKKENSKRRKEGLNLARKTKDKRERVHLSGNHTHFAAQPNLPPYPTPMIPVDFNDGISYTGELLEQNAQALNRISENIAALQLQENIGLFCQTRENILKIINVLNDMPDAIRQMPQLRERIRDKMFNFLLSPSPHPMQL
ncbi:hypothetical protein Goarm_015264 [Gossypium armourianum]|uniref:Uncharacterized protein n=1 Tax=Gossypium armourianum TaxID=34283 RepID=A0A7J9JA62_9ROSI|nr:hypothetical protein [Gossypium armourianum]